MHAIILTACAWLIDWNLIETLYGVSLQLTTVLIQTTIAVPGSLPPIMDEYTRRIIGFGVHPGNVDGTALCRMFSDATSRKGWPTHISSDNDPLFQYHRWNANLRVLDIDEIRSLPHVPLSHPFVERLIGSIRRELLDQTLFWTATDLENKLREYQCYYNEYRTHSGRDGCTPIETPSAKMVDIINYRWEKHCRGLFELPIAA